MSLDAKRKSPDVAWWSYAGEGVARLHTRLTNRQSTNAVLDLIGKWYVSDFPPPNNLVNFEDKTVLWDDGPLQTKPKLIENQCYIHLPVKLAWKPADDTIQRLRRVHTIPNLSVSRCVRFCLRIVSRRMA